ncbi:hypothetical protein HELRODRAFT_175948 [Helobdella robusta]|uniref:Uncharacterized protein n=1 Tax=Helobdella robusta TaxID=6412 RepID=T1F9Y2_HELRO|nr:hypothetical protein HELRODRAFT_175948 [Helobdella robusta]ESO00507.1 hypothetical protein HELRODRAFT_175948 [Helobdella robusta]
MQSKIKNVSRLISYKFLKCLILWHLPLMIVIKVVALMIVKSDGLDIFVVTESWHGSSKNPSIALSTPPGYRFVDCVRDHDLLHGVEEAITSKNFDCVRLRSCRSDYLAILFTEFIAAVKHIFDNRCRKSFQVLLPLRCVDILDEMKNGVQLIVENSVKGEDINDLKSNVQQIV